MHMILVNKFQWNVCFRKIIQKPVNLIQIQKPPTLFQVQIPRSFPSKQKIKQPILKISQC